MTRLTRLMMLVMVPAVLWFASWSVASDLDALMREFRVSPAGSKPAPAFTLQGLDGKVRALADHRGRAVLLYFWATW